MLRIGYDNHWNALSMNRDDGSGTGKYGMEWIALGWSTVCL